ncbi:MAG TPA: hypothetical protein VFW11_23260 [Cyclobacteriaceae bacterium]|nr:hypothetical protein [Cyclobacteriaceae bacterium]
MIILRSALTILVITCFNVLHAQEQYVETIQLFGFDEGAAVIRSHSWEVLTKVHYNAVEDLFAASVPSGYVREYYIGFRKADNITSCSATGVQFRFYFSWSQRGGHEFNIGWDWGDLKEGRILWVKVPGTDAQVQAGSIPNGYWRIDARIPNSCSSTGVIFGVYAKAIDRVGGSQPSIVFNNEPVATSPLYSLGGIYDDRINLKDGRVGIGTTQPDTKLTVKGTIHSEEIKVDLSIPVPDYVFEENYSLVPLVELSDYLQSNKHRPDVPSAKSMEQAGVNVGEMNMLLLKKVEELTLYLIEQQKEIEILKEKINQSNDKN